MLSLLILLHIYFVSFLDKPEKTAPQLSPRAVEQRAKWHIPTDQMDYPVSQAYMNELVKKGVKIHHKSRWFNGVTCEMDKELAEKIADLDFVTDVEMTRDNSTPIYYAKHRMPSIRVQTEGVYEGDMTDNQLNIYNLFPLIQAGYEGQGILMAICDGAFYNANSLSCFRPDELQLGAYDFTDDKTGFYGYTGTHGTECLSVITGVRNSFYGAATRAQYVLMRSEEEDTESPKEMDNLVAALETADSLGVNVFSVSLGYAMFDNDAWTLPKSALDGKSTRVSLAATIAARKGMLVCVAAGNEGNSTWRTISAPADADSILTVGAVDVNGKIGDFSSFGPSADGRIKPEVCAVGVRTTLIYPDGSIVRNNGTSFATPLLAGLAATLWSALPDENAMQIRERIIQSADRYTTPDINQYGYGIPDAWIAYQADIPSAKQNTLKEVNSTKVLRNGQLLILHNGATYSVLGQLIE